METTHELLHLDKWSLLQWKIVDITASFIWIIIFFNGPFEYGDGRIFKLLRWMQNLRQSTWDNKMLYAERSSMAKQLLVIPLPQKTKNTNMFKYIFHFMETTHELLRLDIWSFVHWKIMDILMSFIWIVIFFDGDFEYGSGSTFWSYVWTNAELLCVEFYNFVQCHMFISYILLLLNLI
jgi:hypothetical protein